MKFINAQQLAFVLDIKKEDARAKMCVAWSKSKGIPNSASRDEKGKIKDDYPQAMEVKMLSIHLNLPMLITAVDNIVNHYLKSPGSKKYILCDFPEKAMRKSAEEGKPCKLVIPPALKSMLSNADVDYIHNEWIARYKKNGVIV